MNMKSLFSSIKLNKSGIGLLVLALSITGISAKAAEDSKDSSGSFIFCVKQNSNEVAYPATATCPKGYTKLTIGQKGERGEDGKNGKDGKNGATGPAGPAGPAGLNGTNGTNGTNGIDGATGPAGPAGIAGANGTNGIDGATGPAGPAGPAGAPGLNGLNAPATQYAVGYVFVGRAGGTPTPWASYSTSLGSPFDNTASGTFRFTCRTAPCVVSLAAQSTASGVTVWPRVMIYKSDINTGQIFGQCEYGDGVSSASVFGPVNTTFTPLSVNIGGSLDCGAGALQTYVSPGDVSSIVVPAGYYDVQTTFTFKG
jgi:hypothetical protein